MCDGESKGPLMVGSCLTAVALLLIAILVPMHFSYVDLNHYGLKKGRTSGEVDTSEAYDTGRYGWGVSTVALNFDSKWREVKFTGSRAPQIFTDAGEITIGVSFYYAITLEGLPTTFESFAEQYHPIIEDQSLDSIKNAAAQFTTVQYQTQRPNITEGLYRAVQQKLASLVHVSVPRSGFFLRRIELPPRVLTKRLESFQQEQEQITQGFQLRNQQYRLETAQNVSRIDRERDVVRSQATVNAQALRDNARNRARALKQKEEGTQLNNMVTSLGLTSSVNGTLRLVQFISMLDATRAYTILDNVISDVFL